MMKTFTPRVILMLAFSLMSIGSLYAQNYKDQLTVTLDNDEYINPSHDRYYTAGAMTNFTHALSTHKNDSSSVIKKLLESQFGQRIYTSYRSDAFRVIGIGKAALTYNQDRPFTGYLFAGASMDWLYANESALQFNVQIGTIGPAALGQQVQSDIHKVVGAYPPRGWDYQLKNEPGLNLRLDYSTLLYRNTANWFDVSFNPDGWLGNTFTGASAGLQFRVGQMNKFFQSASTNSRVTQNASESIAHEFYFFTVPQVNYVAYDATIEGGLFIKDKGPVTFGIYHWVYQQQFGLQFASARWSANYIAYIRTREVKSTALGDQWGSFSVAYRFGKI